MRHRARNLDTEQPGNAQQEAEHAGDKAAPHKHLSVPFRGVEELRQRRQLSLEEDEGCQEDNRAEVLPVRQLDGGVVGVWQRGLDEDRVNRDE